MQWTLQIRPLRSAISLSVVRPLSQAHTVTPFHSFKSRFSTFSGLMGPCHGTHHFIKRRHLGMFECTCALCSR